MECSAKKADTEEFHPLKYQQLKIAQDKDKTIQKILEMPKTLYFCKDFHGGGKTTSLICFKEKIVIPGRLQ
jgi:type II secretory ATPase GspE/PulE/Tfp pilus assembly ATPase PilB-like protein